MSKLPYFPTDIGSRILWMKNYAEKIQIHGPNVGLTAAEITATVFSLAYAIYLLEVYIPQIQSDAREATAYKDLMLDAPATGMPLTPLPTPTPFTPPGLVAPGILKRLFNQVVRVKADPGYTPAVGEDLQIIGTENKALHPNPEGSLKLRDGLVNDLVDIFFTKFGHDGVMIESRINGGPWQQLTIATESPYTDARNLTVPGQPETREYRIWFWDKGQVNGGALTGLKVTVGA